MAVLLWDASALAKRYAPEVGSDTVDALFAAVPTARMVSSIITYAEIYSILLRKFNRAAIDLTAFDTAKSALRAELINDPDFVLLSIDDTAFYSGIALMEAHNLNATDAALLILFQNYVKTVDSGSKPLLCWLPQMNGWYAPRRRKGFAPLIRSRFLLPMYLRFWMRCSARFGR